jgi:shikimate dehydrogenase
VADPPISARTRLAAVIGWPVAHSLSPAMHNAAFRALGLDWVYLGLAVPPERVPEALRGLAAAGCGGLNVTIPHKVAALEAASAATDAARAIGAANTLVPDGAGGFRADNTDAAGFLRALDEGEGAAPDLRGRDVLLIGAGGAARAVAVALRGRGARLRVANRTTGRAAALGETVPFTPIALAEAARGSTLVVNATSLGMHDDAVPAELPVEALGPGQTAFDLVYRRGGTPWLHAVAARGVATVDGREMLLHQGAAAFVQWTGVEPPVGEMRAALG